MNKHEHNHQQKEGQDHILVPQDHKPYWKRMHHTLIFWVFLFLMLACILYYIVSVDFAFAPHIRLK